MPFSWPPPKRRVKVNVVLPASNTSILPDLRAKTEFLGRLARILSIYRVDTIIVFNDSEASEGDVNLFKLVLEYMLIPPYLRRRLVPIIPELRYAGILHPLNIVTHNPEGRRPVRNDVREGIVVQSFGNKGKVFIGYSKLCYTYSSKDLIVNERVLVRVVNEDPLRCEVIRKDEIPYYIGYEVKVASNIYSLLRLVGGGVTILASKAGDDYGRLPLRKALIKRIKELGSATIFLGNHSKDFNELVSTSSLQKLNFMFKLNFIPYQGVLSVRTLEALEAILAILNTDLETFNH